MIKSLIRFCLVIMGSMVVSTACISMQNEEDNLETRARRSMHIAGEYVRAYGRLVNGDDNTPCPTLTFEAPWAKMGFAEENASLLKMAINFKKIPISVRVIATDRRDKEIWRTERNDNDPKAPVEYNYDEIIKRAESRIEAFSRRRETGSYGDEEGEEEIGTGENVYDFEQDEVLYGDGFDYSYVDPKKEAEQERRRIERNNSKG